MGAQVSVKYMSVSRLFGRFNYEINFSDSAHDGSGITFITAPNGYGKSTLLRLINNLACGKYVQLSRILFSELLLQTSDGREVLVTRLPSLDSSKPEDLKLRFEKKFPKHALGPRAGPNTWEISITPERESGDDDDLNLRKFIGNVGALERDMGLKQIGVNKWRDTKDGQIYRREDLFDLFRENQAGALGHRKSEPEWLLEFRKDLNVLYIPANRLQASQHINRQQASRHILYPGRPRDGEVVETISDRVLDQIRESNVGYAKLGRKLEQDFPSRVIEAIGSKQEVELKEIRDLLDEVRNQESDYQELGLLSEVQTGNVRINITDSSALLVLRIYLEDIKKKLQSLKETADRLRVFIETMNSMLLFKTLDLSPDDGFQFLGDNKQAIPLRALSSGEQHLIALLGEIIFESVDGGIVLLDEPEISFHPEWQERFPKVLESVVKLNNCMIVMATHSPTLIQDKWDSVVELAEQVRK